MARQKSFGLWQQQNKEFMNRINLKKDTMKLTTILIAFLFSVSAFAQEKIVAYFQKQKDIDKSKIVLIGESQGGLVSALAASELKKQVSNLVLIYPALCIPDNWNERYPRVEDIPEVSEIWGVKLGKKFMMDIRPMKPFELIGNYKGNVLIVHGTDDKVVPIDYSKRAVEIYQNATIKIIDKAGHGFNPEERILSNQYVKEFLNR